MVTKKDIAIVGAVSGGAFLLYYYRNVLFGASEEAKAKIEETIKYITEAEKYIVLLQEEQEDFDTKIIQYMANDVITDAEETEIKKEMEEMSVKVIIIHDYLNKAKESAKGASNLLGDNGWFEKLIVKPILSFLNTIVARYGFYIALGITAIGLWKGRRFLYDYLKKRKKGGGKPEQPAPIVLVVSYPQISNITHMPSGITNEYNPMYVAPTIPEEVPTYPTVPIETLPEELPLPTPHEEEAINKWKLAWTTVETASAETKNLIKERLPSPLNNAIDYSWDYLPAAFFSLFSGPIITYVSMHHVAVTGEWGRFAVAVALIVAAVLLIIGLIYVGLLVVSGTAATELSAILNALSRAVAIAV